MPERRFGILAVVAVALGVAVAGSAPAGADPSAFGALSCGCHAIGPAGSQVRLDQINRGIEQGESGSATNRFTTPR